MSVFDINMGMQELARWVQANPGQRPAVGQNFGGKVWDGNALQDQGNPADVHQQATWKGAEAGGTEKKLTGYADYLMGPQRRGEILGQNFRALGLRQGSSNEAMAGLAAKGITNPLYASRFMASQERDLAGVAFTGANEQTRSDQSIGAGILGNIYNRQSASADAFTQADIQYEQKKQEQSGFGGILGSIGGTILGAATGGIAGSLGTSAFSWGKQLFGGGSSGGVLDTGLNLPPPEPKQWEFGKTFR